ncbi:hypothetical protein JXA59_02210 [Patescibacteria group bacterium]|nr:hypothetical protein [Patescibacteria group bacterium]
MKIVSIVANLAFWFGLLTGASGGSWVVALVLMTVSVVTIIIIELRRRILFAR